MPKTSRVHKSLILGLLLVIAGIILTINSQVSIQKARIKEVKVAERVWNITASFNEGDKIFGYLMPPPFQKPGWQDSAEPPSKDIYYGYIPVSHVFIYVDLYDSEGNHISEVEIVYAVAGFQNLYMYNLSRVIITNETGPYPRIKVETLDGWFELGTANSTEYTISVWGFRIGPGTGMPPPSILGLGKKEWEITTPYRTLIFLGIPLCISGAIILTFSLKTSKKALSRRKRRKKMKFSRIYSETLFSCRWYFSIISFSVVASSAALSDL